MPEKPSSSSPPLVARSMSPHPDTRRRGLSNRRPGAQPGNANALKHGFYTGGAVFAPPSRPHETGPRHALGREQSPRPGRRLWWLVL